MATCVFCPNELTEDTKPEHTFLLNAHGGRKTTTGVDCGRGVRSGLPDLLVIWRAKPIFVEIKSRAGVASKAQKQICAKLKLAGADWYLARSAPSRADGLESRRAWCSGVNGSRRGSSLGRDRSRTRRGGCRRRRTWRRGDGPHDGDGGCVSGYDRPRNWQQRATMPRAVTSPHRAVNFYRHKAP